MTSMVDTQAGYSLIDRLIHFFGQAAKYQRGAEGAKGFFRTRHAAEHRRGEGMGDEAGGAFGRMLKDGPIVIG